MRQSNVVTKVFNVEYAEPQSCSSSSAESEDEDVTIDNGINFQYELKKDSTRKVIEKMLLLLLM